MKTPAGKHPPAAARETRASRARQGRPHRSDEPGHDAAAWGRPATRAQASWSWSGVQPQLTVGPADDELEREADRVADRVMRMPTSVPPPVATEEEEEEEIRTKPVAAPGPWGLGIQRACAECQDELLAGAVRRKAEGASAPASPSPPANPVPGAGRPMDDAVRGSMEQRFGRGFGGVRIHTGPGSAEAARSIGARAYTLGHHVVFGAGEYAPHTARGQRLLAHELTHVVQQGEGAAAHDRTGRTVQRAGMTEPPPPEVEAEPAGSDSEADRLARIRSITGELWVDSWDESELFRLWESFGEDLPRVMAENQELWEASQEAGAELEDLPEVERLGTREFERDVKYLANFFMDANQEEVDLGLMQLGAETWVSDDGSTTATILSRIDKDVSARLTLLKEQGGLIQDAQTVSAALREILLGIATRWKATQWGALEEVYFDPELNPADLRMFARAVGAPTWDDTKTHWDEVQSALNNILASYPSLYALLQADRLGEFMQGDEVAARTTLVDALTGVLSNIQKSRGMLAEDDLDWRDLTPVHERLYAGEPSVSGVDWSDPFAQWAAKAHLAGHETQEFWIEMGLATLGAAAFIVAEFATFGTATFFIAAGAGVGISVGIAGSKWEAYDDLSVAAASEVSGEHSLVTDAAVQAARNDALIESAFAFLDVLGPAVRGAKEVRRVGKLAKEGVEEGAEAAVKTGVRQADEVAEAAGKGAAREAGEAAAKEASQESLAWARKALRAPADMLSNLTEAGIQALRTLGDELLERFRALSDALKRMLCGCASPCKVDPDKIRTFLEHQAKQGVAAAARAPSGILRSSDDIVAALKAVAVHPESGLPMDVSWIAKKLKGRKAIVTFIEEAGITADDLSSVVLAMTTADTSNPKMAYNTFVRTLTSLVPAKIGKDVGRLNAIVAKAAEAAPGELHIVNALKGAMFENFGRLYVTRFRMMEFGRIAFTRADVPGLTATRRTSDGYVKRLKELWDFKHTTGRVPVAQSDDYAKILASQRAKGYPDVESINYLFPAKEGAEANADLMRKEGFRVWFLDAVTGEPVRYVP